MLLPQPRPSVNPARTLVSAARTPVPVQIFPSVDRVWVQQRYTCMWIRRSHARWRTPRSSNPCLDSPEPCSRAFFLSVDRGITGERGYSRGTHVYLVVHARPPSVPTLAATACEHRVQLIFPRPLEGSLMHDCPLSVSATVCSYLAKIHKKYLPLFQTEFKKCSLQAWYPCLDSPEACSRAFFPLGRVFPGERGYCRGTRACGSGVAAAASEPPEKFEPLSRQPRSLLPCIFLLDRSRDRRRARLQQRYTCISGCSCTTAERAYLSCDRL